MLGSSAVMATRAREVIERTVGFAEGGWQRIDERDVVRDVFVACGVPDAEYKLYALESIGSSMSMPMGMPAVLVIPEPSRRVARTDPPKVVDRLDAELYRAFEIEGAVHPRPDRRRG